MDLVNKLLYLLIATLILSTPAAYALTAIYANANISNVGNVSEIRTLYCETSTDHIDWGDIDVGDTKQITIQARVTGNTYATLDYAVSNWNPIEASEYLTLTMTQYQQILTPNEWVDITLELSVSPQCQTITTFAFDITVTATSID